MATSETTLTRAGRALQQVYAGIREGGEKGGLSPAGCRQLQGLMDDAMPAVLLASKIEDGPCTPQPKRRYGVNRSDGEHKTEAR